MKIIYILILLFASNIIIAQDNIVAKIQKVTPKRNTNSFCSLPTFAPEPTYYLYRDGTFKIWDLMTGVIGQGEYSRISNDTILFEFNHCDYFESKISISEEQPKKEGIKLTIGPFGEPAYGAKLIITRDSFNLTDTFNIGFDDYFSLNQFNLKDPFSIKILYDPNRYETVTLDLPKWESNNQLNIELGYKNEMIPSKIMDGEKLYFIVNEKEKLGYSFYNSKTKEHHILRCSKKFELLKKIKANYK